MTYNKNEEIQIKKTLRSYNDLYSPMGIETACKAYQMIRNIKEEDADFKLVICFFSSAISISKVVVEVNTKNTHIMSLIKEMAQKGKKICKEIIKKLILKSKKLK